MIITLKLVGTNKETNINITSNTSIDDVSIVDIFNYLMENNLSYDEVSKLMFINNGTNISNDTNYKLTNESIIHIFINDFDIKKELLKYIFNKEDIKEEHDDNHFDDNDNHSNQSDNENENDSNHSNDNIIKLFSDNDFTYLLKICLTKPDLINKVSSYLLNGNITTEIKTINDNDFKYNDIYLQLVELLNKLNITKDEIEMKSVVQHFDGNLNLSLRYLITKY